MNTGRCFASLLLLILSSCVDLSEQQFIGPYYVADDPAASYETLYYRSGNGLDFERIRHVRRAGYTRDFIFVEAATGYYWIKRAQDPASDIGDPAVRKAISQPLTRQAFRAVLDSVGLPDFAFQYSAI